MTKDAIIVVPARGGSKRFPRKNIALLAGKPLLSYAIRAGLGAKRCSGVFVSTEDREIADIALAHGAEVPYLRPSNLAGDRVTADEAVAHMARHVSSQIQDDYSIVVLIQPTSPFVCSKHIDDAVSALIENPQWDSLITMSKVDHRFHPYNLSLVQESGDWQFLFEENRRKSRARQEKPDAQSFCNLFAVRKDVLQNHGRFGEAKGSILLDNIYAWDIDYAWELAVAEHLLNSGFVALDHQ